MTSASHQPEPLAHRLAARLAARILHDLSGPASGVASGLDLLAVGGGDDDAALDLAASSARSLLDLIEFHQVAFGGRGEAVSGAVLKRLALTQFEGRRPTLEWEPAIEPFPALAAQATLILAQIAASALAVGGVAHLSASRAEGELVIKVDGRGPRAALQPETLEGLAGRGFSHGLAGRWAPSRYLHALIAEIGGAVTVTAGVDEFALGAVLPSGAAA
jgi:histidine phosphotransferase ChpT